MNAPAQRTPEWHRQRTGIITGSRVSAILGANPYQNAEDVLREMVRQHFGAPSEFAGNRATEYGTQHEPDARAAYERATGNIVEETGLVIHPKWEWLGASPDGLVDHDGTVEFKCPINGVRTYVPNYYWHQMQLVMAATERQWCDYFEWSPDALFCQRVPAESDWLERYWGDLASFIDRYEATISDEERARPFLADKYEQRTDGDWLAAVSDWKDAQDALKAAQAHEKDVRERLIELADGKPSEGGGVRLIRSTRKGSIDYSKVPLEGIDLEQYRKPDSEYFQLRMVKDAK